SFDEREQTKTQWLAQFNSTFGTNNNAKATTFNGSIPQALMIMNGDLVKKATNYEPGSFLHKMATSNELNSATRIKYLYLTALAQEPSTREIQISNQLLTAQKGNVPKALKDIW